MGAALEKGVIVVWVEDGRGVLEEVVGIPAIHWLADATEATWRVVLTPTVEALPRTNLKKIHNEIIIWKST